MLAPGSRIGDYTLLRRAGIGATSEVYEGRHVGTGRTVAVKVLHDEWCLHLEVVARFLNEAHALQHIQHPRIVTVFACGALPEGPPFMILEWLPMDLERALAHAGGTFPAPSAARVASQVAEALAALHDLGIVHRDLKPANVLLAQEEIAGTEVKLADLGLAKVLPEEATARTPGMATSICAVPVSTGGNALLGTWEYMAPEQWIRAKDVDPKADVYALGALLFQMLTGRPPFVGGQQKDLMCFHLFEPPPLHLLDGLLAPSGRSLVAAMLSKKPSLRPVMREVMARLGEVAGASFV